MPRFWIYKSIAFRNIFYYIDLIYKNNPSNVIDIGCGECIWKKYYPNIIGLDTHTTEYTKPDIGDFFDSDFSSNNKKQYECGMALGSLHFNEWKNIRKIIIDAMNIVSDRFLFTFNFDRLNEHSSTDTTISSLTDIEKVKYIKDILNALPYGIIMLDYANFKNNDMCHTFEKICNGHIRFILEHLSEE